MQRKLSTSPIDRVVTFLMPFMQFLASHIFERAFSHNRSQVNVLVDQPSITSVFYLNCIFQQNPSYFRNAGNLKIENKQRLLFKVNTFDHKDNVRPEFRTNGD